MATHIGTKVTTVISSGPARLIARFQARLNSPEDGRFNVLVLEVRRSVPTRLPTRTQRDDPTFGSGVEKLTVSGEVIRLAGAVAKW